MDKNFKIILDTINDNIAILNNNNRKLYDYDNPEYCITEVVYDSEADKLFFKTEEENNECITTK